MVPEKPEAQLQSAKKLLQTHSKAKGKTLLIKVNDLSENERKKELVNIS